jgi:hypothetical protein
MGATEPYYSYRPIDLWPHHYRYQGDNGDGDEGLSPESTAGKQQQEHHGHSGVFALVLGDISSKGVNNQLFHSSLLAKRIRPSIRLRVKLWSRREESNTPSADYRSAALTLSYTGKGQWNLELCCKTIVSPSRDV